MVRNRNQNADMELDGDVESIPTTALVPASSRSTSPSAQNTIMVSNEGGMIDKDDIIPALLRLGQSTTPEVQQGKAKQGTWLMSGFPPMDSVAVVPLMYYKDRQRRIPGKLEVACRSFDTIHGIGNPGILCENCKFKDADWENGIKPQCNLRYNLILFSLSHNLVCRYIAQSSATKVAKQLLGMVQGAALNNNGKGFGTFAVKLGSYVKGNPAYAIPTIEFADVNPDVIATISDMYSAINVVPEEIETAAE